MLEAQVPVVIRAGSSSAQRGLASLLVPDEFRATELLDWSAPSTLPYEAVLGEMGVQDDPAYLTEPFVVLSAEVSLEPGPGRALLHPDTTDSVILAALRAVLLGLSVRDEYHLAGDQVQPHTHDLTPREVEILAFLGDGHTNRQIAETLHISQNTVKFHLSSIFSKLQVASRAEAVTVGLRSGIILL